MPAKSILIVDDEISIRAIIRNSLESRFRIFEASTYGETMKFPAQSIDLAIIDYVLPDRDGFEVLRSLRAGKPAMPVIMMTGHGDEDVIIKALRQNVIDYIKKPISLKYLRQRVSVILADEERKDDRALSAPGMNYLDTIAHIIRTHYMEDISLDGFARLAGMSRFSFCRAFKRNFHQSYTSYVNSVRLHNARELLITSGASITDVAFAVGFKNSGHFNRVFKAACHMSPREYRRRRLYVDGNVE